MDKFTFVADKKGIRLDKFLAEQTGISRSKVKRDILGGFVSVDGELEPPDYRLKGGELIEYSPSPPEEVEIKPEPIPLEVIYQDEHILVINKPAGLVVHPGAGNPSGTLVNALLYWFNDWNINGYIRPGIVHRLDKDTSGVMVVARKENAQKKLIEQFKERRVKKKYLAFVVGKIPDKGVIDIAIGRDRYNRLKFSPLSTSAKEAITEWEVIERWDEVAFLKVMPRTGRTHQIRVHLSYKGYPLVGDELYGGMRKARKIKDENLRKLLLSFPRHALHAEYLAFYHPETGDLLEFSVPIPEDMETLINNLRQWYDSLKIRTS